MKNKSTLLFFLCYCSLLQANYDEILLGKTITKIEIEGLNDEQKKNAEIFLRLKSIEGEKIGASGAQSIQNDYAYFLLEQGKKEIALSQQPFSYYNTEVKWEIKDLNDDHVQVVYQVNLGDSVKIDKVHLKMNQSSLVDKDFIKVVARHPFKKEQAFLHQEYEQYKSKLASVAEDKGYFDYTFIQHQVDVDTEKNKADVYLHFDSKERYRYGTTVFKSKKEIALDEGLLYRYLNFKEGDYYQADELSTFHQNLQNSQYFSEVLVSGNPHRETRSVPIEVQLTMNKNKHYLYGLGYSTDHGIRGRFAFDRRWVNRRGHQTSLALYASQKQNGLEAIYRIPALKPYSDYYYLKLEGKHKNTQHQDGNISLEGGYVYKQGNWVHRYALTALYERFSIGDYKNKVRLFYPKSQWTYTKTNDLLNPLHGMQFRFDLQAANKLLLSDVNWFQANADAKFIYSSNDEKHRLITRLGLGANWTNNFNRLPPSKRYFYGGDRNIRGYRFESIGEYDQYGENLGGKYRYFSSLEYEYYIKEDIALAAFVDIGDSFIKKSNPKVGAGVGLHWRSPVGSMRLDLAHGFDKKIGKKIYMHLNIGTEFDL